MSLRETRQRQWGRRLLAIPVCLSLLVSCPISLSLRKREVKINERSAQQDKETDKRPLFLSKEITGFLSKIRLTPCPLSLWPKGSKEKGSVNHRYLRKETSLILALACRIYLSRRKSWDKASKGKPILETVFARYERHGGHLVCVATLPMTQTRCCRRHVFNICLWQTPLYHTTNHTFPLTARSLSPSSLWSLC